MPLATTDMSDSSQGHFAAASAMSQLLQRRRVLTTDSSTSPPLSSQAAILRGGFRQQRPSVEDDPFSQRSTGQPPYAARSGKRCQHPLQPLLDLHSLLPFLDWQEAWAGLALARYRYIAGVGPREA